MATEPTFTLDESTQEQGAQEEPQSKIELEKPEDPALDPATVPEQASLPGNTSPSFYASALATSTRILSSAKLKAVTSVTAVAEQVSQKFTRDSSTSIGGTDAPADADLAAAAGFVPGPSSGPTSAAQLAGAASMVRDRAAAAASSMAKETATVAAAAKETAAAAASDIGKKAREVYNATAEGIKRLTTPARKVTAICKQEHGAKPIPHLVVSCCTVIVVSGLRVHNVFGIDMASEAVDALAASLEAPSMSLVPSNMDPVGAATVLKHWLASLDEPLLLSKLADKWVAAGQPDLVDAPAALRELLLSLPAANLATLRMIIETCYRIASQSNTTGMNALSLGQVLAPLLLWRVQPSPPMLRTPVLPNMQALKSRLTGQPAAKAPVTCVDSAAETCGSTGAEDASGAKESSGGGAVDEAPVPVEIHREGNASGGGDAHLHGEDDEGEAIVPKGTRLPLTGADLEAVVRVVEFTIINYDELLA